MCTKLGAIQHGIVVRKNTSIWRNRRVPQQIPSTFSSIQGIEFCCAKKLQCSDHSQLALTVTCRRDLVGAIPTVTMVVTQLGILDTASALAFEHAYAAGATDAC